MASLYLPSVLSGFAGNEPRLPNIEFIILTFQQWLLVTHNVINIQNVPVNVIHSCV